MGNEVASKRAGIRRRGQSAVTRGRNKDAIRGGLWYSLHRWASLPVWIFLLFICVTGSLAVVSDEISWLVSAETRAPNPAGAAHVGYDRIVTAVTERWPAADIHFIDEPASYLATRVWISLPDAREATAYVNPYTGAVQGLRRGPTFSQFLRALHGWLLVPWHGGTSWGYYLVGFLALPLLGSLITALVVDKYFWRAFYRPTIRTGLTRRIFWSDIHRLLGVWSIWFVALIGLTGGWYLAQGALWDAGMAVTPPAPMIERATLPTVPEGAPDWIGLDANVATARAAIPDLDVKWISLPETGYHHTEVFGRGRFPLVSDFTVAAYVNPYNGELGGAREVSDLTTLQWLQALADPLHFGDFAGLISKLVWFFFGLVLSFIIFTGMLVWLKRTASNQERVRRSGIVKNAAKRRWAVKQAMSWRRQKYHLNAALLAVPLLYLSSALETGDAPSANAMALETKAVGPWTVQPLPESAFKIKPGGQLDLMVRFERGPLDHIRAAFLTLDKAPPTVNNLLTPDNAALHGGKSVREAHVPVPDQLTGDEALWLTVEAWDGSVYQSAWTLPGSAY